MSSKFLSRFIYSLHRLMLLSLVIYFSFHCSTLLVSRSVDLAVSGNETLVEQSSVSTSPGVVFVSASYQHCHIYCCANKNTLPYSCAPNSAVHPYNLLNAWCVHAAEVCSVLRWTVHKPWIESCEFLTVMIMQEHLWAFFLLMDLSDVK